MTRRSLAIGTTILLVWMVTMGYLVRKHLQKSDDLEGATKANLFNGVSVVEKWTDLEENMLILNGKQVIGASRYNIRRLDNLDTTSTYAADFGIQAKISPLLPPVVVKVHSILDSKQNLTKFIASGMVGVPVTVQALLEDKILYIRTDKPNGFKLKKYSISEPISLAELVRPTLFQQLPIETGQQMSTPVLDPLTGTRKGIMAVQIGDLEDVKVGDKDVKAYKVRSEINGLVSTSWVDKYGRTVRRQLVGEFAMEQATRKSVEQAAPELSAIGTEDFVPEVTTELSTGDFTTVPLESLPAGSSNDGGPLGFLGGLL